MASAKPETGLSKRASGPLSKKERTLSVGALEAALFRAFPKEDVEDWDRAGLTVGDPSRQVTRVAVALDPTVAAIREAASRGANVLVTHHPAFLDPPSEFKPGPSAAVSPGAVVWAAIESGVAVMSFHTGLDASPLAARMLPNMLSLDWSGRVLVPCPSGPDRGYGQLCSMRKGDAPMTLEKLAARCTSVFAQVPRVWGDFDREINSVATYTGSCGSVVAACLREHVDCLICGEVKYHAALDASAAGLAIIDMGHDTTELPFTSVLADAVAAAGVSVDCIEVIDQSGNWSHPESTRL